MWERIFYGNTVKDWVISIAIVVGAVLLNKLIRLLNRKVFRKWSAKSNNKYDDILLSSIEKPFLCGVMLFALWIALSRLTLPDRLHDIIGEAYKILIVLNITWFFARLISSLLEKSTEFASGNTQNKKRLDKKFFPLVNRTLLILIWTIGLIFALSNAGISVGALLGTLGIGGVAIALASQDTIKNILGGITIFTDKAFSLGDIVNISGVEGTVEDIGLRSTRIRTYGKQLVTIPNYKVTDSAIINISKEPKRRVVLKLGVVYNTTPQQIREAIKALLSIPARIPELDQKDFSANFSDYNDSALIITYIYNIRKGADILAVNSKVNLEILDEFNKMGIAFAFPSQTVYIENSDSGTFQEKPKETSAQKDK